MIERREETTCFSTSVASLRSGLSRRVVQECVERKLVMEPLTTDLAELRRVRRLRELGINMAGIEIILRMRLRIQALRAEFSRRDGFFGGPYWSDVEGERPRLLPWDPDSG